MDYKTMNINDIVEWCKANNETEWLKKEASKTFTKDGKTRRITFIEIKKDFVEKFMPEIAPKAKEKKPTMFDLIAAL